LIIQVILIAGRTSSMSSKQLLFLVQKAALKGAPYKFAHRYSTKQKMQLSGWALNLKCLMKILGLVMPEVRPLAENAKAVKYAKEALEG